VTSSVGTSVLYVLGFKQNFVTNVKYTLSCTRPNYIRCAYEYCSVMTWCLEVRRPSRGGNFTLKSYWTQAYGPKFLVRSAV